MPSYRYLTTPTPMPPPAYAPARGRRPRHRRQRRLLPALICAVLLFGGYAAVRYGIARAHPSFGDPHSCQDLGAKSGYFGTFGFTTTPIPGAPIPPVSPSNGQPDRFTWPTANGSMDAVIACAGGDASWDGYGQPFQCEELIQRYAWLRWGDSPTDWGNGAARIWDDGQHNPTYPHAHFSQIANGSATPPQPGDIMIWGDYNSDGTPNVWATTGHTAIVASVGPTSFTTLEQNVQWNYQYAYNPSRTFYYTTAHQKDGTHYFVGTTFWGGHTDAPPYGWLHDTHTAPVPLTATQPTIVTTSATSATAFAHTSDGHIVQASFTKGQWSAWQPVSDTTAIAGSPVAPDAHTVFARSADGLIRTATQTNSGWSPWTVLTTQGAPAGGFVGDPAVARYTEHGLSYLQVAATGADGRVYVTSDPGGAWQAWSASGTPATITGSPIMLDAAHLLARAARGGAIMAATWDGAQWSAWHALAQGGPSGGFAGRPVVATTPDAKHPQIFATGADGQLYHASATNGVWSAWTAVGDTTTDFSGGPAAPDQSHLFARAASDNQMRTATWTGHAWTAWQTMKTLPGGFASDPVAASSTVVYALGTDGQLYRNVYQSGAWEGWALVGDAGQHLG